MGIMKSIINSNTILYEDNHILVVCKPVNILSQEDKTGDPDMLTLLKEYIRKRDKKPGRVFLGLVHRLDRPAGGAMVFAKTSKAASRLSEQIRNRTFGKEYLAVITGNPAEKHGRLEDFLIKDHSTNIVRTSSEAPEKGKKSVLEYIVLETKQDISLINVNLLTGRPHQIRVQLAAAGYPLYGDQKYGSTGTAKDQIALWSYRLTFKHPVQNEDMKFISIPPDVFPWNLFKIT